MDDTGAGPATAVAAPSFDAEEFRRLGHELIDWVAGYLANPESYPVLPATRPGAVRSLLPDQAPEEAESLEQCFADFQRLILPNTTHWNHPGFLAYFPNTGSAPGVLAELLTAALNVNAMIWRTGPAATELEEVTTDWLRTLLGLPAEFSGTINDTASSSTFYALAAAREQLTDLRLREEGMTGRPELPQLRVYCSEEAHSSVDKAVIALGLGFRGLRLIPTRTDFTMDVQALRAAINEDVAGGVRPVAVVGSVGTTAVTAVDPLPEIAALCREHGIWLHVDAAYGGSAALLPERRWILDGAESADSLVVNPHKWLLVPMDCSVLYTRKPALLRAAFSLTPEYLTTAETGAATNLMDFGISLGRRFRALKLWFVMRAFGAEGLRAQLREHIRIAHLFAGWVDEHPQFERLAPTHFSVVAFRSVPPNLAGDETRIDLHNQSLLDTINASGRFFLSHTRVRGQFTLRVAIGNLGTTETHIRDLWGLIQLAAGATPAL
ncbi:MAG: pyridoxal phosphate-dependent decarboxylase family protein [Longimicrobiales bacterium]